MFTMLSAALLLTVVILNQNKMLTSKSTQTKNRMLELLRITSTIKHYNKLSYYSVFGWLLGR